MKKIALIGLVLLAALSASAQVEKGKIFLTGNIGYASGTTTKQGGGENKTSNFSFMPSVGYFITDNISLGLGIGYNSTSSKSQNGNNELEVTSSEFVIMPHARYYYSLADNFYIFGQGGLSYGSGKSKVTNNGNSGAESETSSLGVNIAPGLAFFPSDRWAIELTSRGLGYSSKEVKDGDKDSNFHLGVDFAPTLGVSVFF